ncbi:rnhA, partial [Mucuna pruriens]
MVQHPIYFISKVLQDTEKRYQTIENAALTLVIASRRLCLYFQGHSIIVRTNLLVKQVLKKPDLARRMVTWSVQLSEFDISYECRGHTKAQALADFIIEMTAESIEKEVKGGWFLLVDEASNPTGSGAGVILEGPNGVLIEQSLHFEFKASNNQAEYEALLAEMRLAKELEAKTLTAKSDSKLITGQVNGEYQARDPKLMKYLDKATKMAATFEKFTLLHMPRGQNERAHLLSKLATSQKREV